MKALKATSRAALREKLPSFLNPYPGAAENQGRADKNNDLLWMIRLLPP
jgi:hypothetical protein